MEEMILGFAAMVTLGCVGWLAEVLRDVRGERRTRRFGGRTARALGR